MNAACSGFLFALNTAAKFVESGQYKKVVVVGADKMSAITDYTDRTTCPLFGDGAAAVMVEPVRPRPDCQAQEVASRARPDHHDVEASGVHTRAGREDEEAPVAPRVLHERGDAGREPVPA